MKLGGCIAAARPLWISIVLAGAFAVLASGCGGSGGGSTAAEATDAPPRQVSAATRERPSEPPPVPMTYDGRVGPTNVGIEMADEEKLFEKVGFNLEASVPYRPKRAVWYVATGVNDFGLAQLPQVLLAVEKGAQIVALRSQISQPTAAMIWLQDSGISGIADLRGKTIALTGLAYQEAFLETVLKSGGLTLDDVTVKRVAYGLVSSLLDGKADAVFGGSANVEGQILRARGATPVVKPVQDFGIPPYDELVVIARTNFVANNPEMVRRLLSTMARGNGVAEKHPRLAAKTIEKSVESSPSATPKGTEAALEATLPLISNSGYLDPDRARGLIDWMYREQMIGRRWPVSALITNAYR
jgi:putative hydroxymethylpyrimidine transport system substrate-binding protein